MTAQRRETIQRLHDDARDWELYDGKKSVQVEWYFRETTQLAANVMLYHLEPGAEEGEHFHLADDPGSCSPRSSDEIYVVTKGEVVMLMAEERVVLRAGDGAYAPHGFPHGVANESNEPAELVLVFGPPKQQTEGT